MTDRMWAILEYLAQAEYPRSHTPNEIGYAIGSVASGPRGRSARVPGPGSIIANALTSLARQQLIQMCARPDRMTGTAYRITDDGRTRLAERDEGHQADT